MNRSIMTYYNSYNYDSFVGENYQTPYGGNYDIVPFQVLGDDSSHDFHNQSFFEYDPYPYYDAIASDPPMNGSLVSNSISSFSEPKSIVYDPYSEAVTLFRISYSVQEFTEPEFEEYDPTPYGGGYDLAETYGNPLPPSEVTCYPRSSPDSSSAPKVNVEEEPAPKPHFETKPTPAIEDKQQLQESKECDNTQESSPEKSLGPIDQAEGSGYEYEKPRVAQIPPGYGLEAMDLCESLFGYWPCLARYNKDRHDCREVACEESSCNQWKESTADYIFGSSYPYGYGERRDGVSSYGDEIYGCQRHHQEQSLHRQVEYE